MPNLGNYQEESVTSDECDLSAYALSVADYQLADVDELPLPQIPLLNDDFDSNWPALSEDMRDDPYAHNVADSWLVNSEDCPRTQIPSEHTNFLTETSAREAALRDGSIIDSAPPWPIMSYGEKISTEFPVSSSSFACQSKLDIDYASPSPILSEDEGENMESTVTDIAAGSSLANESTTVAVSSRPSIVSMQGTNLDHDMGRMSQTNIVIVEPPGVLSPSSAWEEHSESFVEVGSSNKIHGKYLTRMSRYIVLIILNNYF